MNYNFEKSCAYLFSFLMSNINKRKCILRVKNISKICEFCGHIHTNVMFEEIALLNPITGYKC